MFEDLFEANRHYRDELHDSGVEGKAARGLAVLTCIDSRIDPLAILGLRAGDAKILRNAGARVTEDSLRSLAVATNLLGVTRVCIIQHTGCAMVGRTDDQLRLEIEAIRNVDAADWTFLSYADQFATISDDLAAIRSCALLPPSLELGGFIFDVQTGELRMLLAGTISDAQRSGER